jgi:hypothetical protein
MRIPFQIKCIILCITLLCLAHGRIHFYSSGFEKHHSKKVKELGKQNRLYGEDEDDDIVQRRKHKPKGRPVAEALVIELNIRQSYYYCEFNVGLTNTSFCTRSQKAHCKRGPPTSCFFS